VAAAEMIAPLALIQGEAEAGWRGLVSDLLPPSLAIELGRAT